MKKIATIIAYILIVLVLVGVIGFIVVFTNGGTSDFKTFYVEYDGEMILQDTEKQLPADKDLTFEVHYTFEKISGSETKDFYVSVVAYSTEETAFEYSVDGKTVSFADMESDFSGCFALVKTESGFTMNIPYEIDMYTCLSSVHTGKMVTVSDTVDLTQTPYFAIKIVSYNEKSTILIPFTVTKGVSGIVLTPDGDLIY